MLSQEQRSLSTEEMRQANHELLSIIRERFESIIYEARLNALNSQLRMNIAEQALQALEIHGFKLNEAGYVGKDMRAPFTAQLDNPDGSRVTIQVLPTDKTTQELSNELVVITKHPDLKTEQEARLQWEELCRTLNQYKLHVGHPEVRAAPPVHAERAEPLPVSDQQLIHVEKQNNAR
jgi:thioesterase domain-containing protein